MPVLIVHLPHPESVQTTMTIHKAADRTDCVTELAGTVWFIQIVGSTAVQVEVKQHVL